MTIQIPFKMADYFSEEDFIPEVTDSDERAFEYISATSVETERLFDKILANELFGKKDEDIMWKFKLYHHLFTFLKIVEERQSLEGETSAYYIDLYNIDCIRRGLLCYGLKDDLISKAFDIYDLDTDEDDEAGIGDMSIEGIVDPFQIT